MRKNFHLSDVLSITTGRLVSTRRMDGIYEILNWLTSDDLSTLALPHAAEQCKPWLLCQYPSLAGIDEKMLAVLDEMVAASNDAPTACRKWIEECISVVGQEWFELEPRPQL